MRTDKVELLTVSGQRRALRAIRARLLRVAPLTAAAVTLVFGLWVLTVHREYARLVAESMRQHAATDALKQVYFSLKDLEAHQRGYLLTGDSTFLSDYRAAVERARTELGHISGLVRSEQESEVVDALSELAEQRLAASADVLSLVDEGAQASLARQVAEGEGRRAMVQFEAAVATVTERVAALQQERARHLDERFKHTFWLILLGTGLATVAGGSSGVSVARYARERADTADRLRVANQRLQTQAAALETQQAVLQDQVTQMEDQAVELELQTQELEESNLELTRSEVRFRALVEQAPDMILVLDTRCCITYSSPAVARVLRRGGEELEGRNLFATVHPDDAAPLRASMDRLVENPGAELDLEFRAAAGGDTWRHLAGRARNLLAEPAVAGIVINCHDATQARSVAAQLRQSQKMEAVGQLAGGVAHDFNNLLTSIRGYAGFVAESIGESHPAHGDLREVLTAAETATALTRQLLTFSRQQVTKPEVLDLNDVVEESAGLLRRLLGPAINLVTQPEPNLRTVLMDPGQIRQVIMNLAVNARDAMPEGGRLVVQTSNVNVDAGHAMRRGVQPGPYVLLSVTDSGEGIPPDVQERIFEPFFTTKEQGRGTGLGLSTVYGIVQQAGGYIWVYSEPGDGATFKIYLPAVTAGADAQTLGHTAPEGGTRSAGSEVLVVEDDDAVRSFARRALERAGFRVRVSASGDEALDVLAGDHDIRLVVSDVIMPGMSGAALGREIADRHPGMPILYTSGYPKDEMTWRGSIPADVAFISKPYSLDELARHVADLVYGRRNGGHAD
ncbi:MAG TPA: ATP-binding protein [Longimicrobiales bacterium]|nr:ATP-binding protein [Longimicrobiales bacterium]